MGFGTRRDVRYYYVTTIVIMAWCNVAAASSAFVVPTTTASPSQSHRCRGPGWLLLANKHKDNNNNNAAAAPSWERRWDEKYQALQEILDGTTENNITITINNNPKLANWLAIQQENLRRGVMNDERREKLAALGIGTSVAITGSSSSSSTVNEDSSDAEDDIREKEGQTKKKASSWDQRWEDSYGALVLFQEEFGHTRVSPRENEKLANWVRIQRENLRRGAMKQDRRERLLKLGLDNGGGVN